MAGLAGKSGPPGNQNAFRHGLAGISQRRNNGALNPSLLARFKEPHTQIIFRTKSSRGIEKLVLQSQAEIGVITNPSNSRLLRLLPCREENIVVVVSAKHPLA
jgi:DNA-binding transcriptional LysR family regulator